MFSKNKRKLFERSVVQVHKYRSKNKQQAFQFMDLFFVSDVYCSFGKAGELLFNRYMIIIWRHTAQQTQNLRP